MVGISQLSQSMDLRYRYLSSRGMNLPFWKDKKVMITGHTGFKGSWLALWLLTMGAEVTGYALPPETSPNHWSLLELPLASRTILAGVKTAAVLNIGFATLGASLSPVHFAKPEPHVRRLDAVYQDTS